MKTKPILLVDQDDVLADFIGAAANSIRLNPAIKFPQCQYKFFENLKPIDDAIESINKLKEYYDVCILTRPSVFNPLCYTEKRVWIEMFLGFDTCRNLILACDKTMVMGDYLIDDNIQTGRFKPTWKHIHFGHGEFKNWKMITEYLIKKATES
jgi:5'-nucleotidase